MVSYNILCLFCPSAAPFVDIRVVPLCIGRVLALALVGYVFGFSPYVLSQMLGHLCRLFIFPVPLVVYLVLLCAWLAHQANPFLLAFLVLSFSFTF